jgi:hypothetical protein
MTHLSTPTPTHALATQRMDACGVWQLPLARARAVAPTVALLALAAFGGYVATSRAAARSLEEEPAQMAPAPTTNVAPPTTTAPPPTPPAWLTIELDDAPPVSSEPRAAAPPSPSAPRAAPKKFRVANDADMAAAARANQASQHALESSLR